MTHFKYANFIATELEDGISAGATEMIIPVAATEALPTLEVGQVIRLVLWDGQQDPEIVSVTDNPQSGVLTIVRGEEDTTAVAWVAGTQVRCVLTAEIINDAMAAFFDLEAVLEANFLPLTGGTLTGNIVLPGPPTDSLHATSKAYVDEIGGSFLPSTGGTMTGAINMNSNQVLGLANPSVASAATRKSYVDNLISGVQGQIATGFAVHATTGTGSAYVISTGQAIAALSDGMAFVIRLHAANLANPTLKVDSTPAKPITVGGLGVTADLLIANTPYTVIYDEVLDDWVLISVTNLTLLTAPVGTRMVFQQTTPPALWTKEAVHNNKAMRLVTGSVVNGGTTAFTSVFAARTIVQANLPVADLAHGLVLPTHTHVDTLAMSNHTHFTTLDAHTHSGTTSAAGSHIHTYDDAGSGSNTFDASGGSSGATPTVTVRTTDAAGVHTHPFTTGNPNSAPAMLSGNPSTLALTGSVGAPSTLPAITGTIQLGGSGTPLDFAVQYVDFTIGVKT